METKNIINLIIGKYKSRVLAPTSEFLFSEKKLDEMATELSDYFAEKSVIDDSTSDGYHTFGELYEFRMLYNAGFFNLLANVKVSLLNYEERNYWMAFYWEVLYNTQEGTIADGIKFGFYLDSIQRAVDALHQVQLFKLSEIREHEIDSVVGMREFLKQYHQPYMKYLAKVEDKFKKEYIDKLIKETNMQTGEVKFLLASDKLIKTMDYKFEDNDKYLNFEIKKVF